MLLGHDYCSKFGVIDAVKERFGGPDEVSAGAYPIWKVARPSGAEGSP
jgi:hypothetical protein